MRARSLKPSLFKNEVLGTADPLYTILFEGLWCEADREGRLEDRPLRVKAEVFPYRDNIDIEAMLDWLASSGFIKRYKVNGLGVIQILKFLEHQHPHKNEVPSALPPVDEADQTKVRRTSNQGTKSAQPKTVPLGLTPSSLTPDSGLLTPDSLIVPNGTMSTSSTVSAEDRIFEHWKTEYAHPKARLDPKRRKLITAALKLYAEPDLIAAISGYKKSPHHMGDNDRHTVYDDIENFLRDAKHIDIGIALSSDRKSGNGLNGHAHFDASRDLVFKSEKEFSAYERAKKSGISFKSQQQWDEHLRGQH